MSMKAIKDLYDVNNMIAPKAISATTTSSALDLALAIENAIVIAPGVWTDGTHTFSLTESADNTTYSAVAAADIVGSLNPVSSTASAVVQKVSYIGNKRYVKVIDTVTAVTTGALIGVFGLTKPHMQAHS